MATGWWNPESELTYHPTIPEAWPSCQGDRSPGSSKDGVAEKPRFWQCPAIANLQWPLALVSSWGSHWSSLLSSANSSGPPGPGAEAPLPQYPVRLSLSPTWVSCSRHGDTGPCPKSRLPPHPLPLAPRGRTVPRLGRGPSSASSSSAFCPFQWGQQPAVKKVPSTKAPLSSPDSMILGLLLPPSFLDLLPPEPLSYLV